MFTLEERIEDLLGPSRSRGVNRDFQCVVHDERRASMSVNMETGLWFCHACGEKGNYERLRRVVGAGPDEDYRWIKAQNREWEEVHNPPDFGLLYRSISGPDGVSSGDRQMDGRTGHGILQDFCDSRGISRRSAEVYGVVEDHQSQSGRIAFPYIDVDGRVTGIKYRYPDGSKRAEPGSEFGLFGVVLASGSDNVLICEGESDTLRAHTELRNSKVGVCGTSGAAVSGSQWTNFGLAFLFTRKIYLGYDADDAGDRVSEVAMRTLGSDRCIRLRPTRGKDITDHLLAGGTMREMVV